MPDLLLTERYLDDEPQPSAGGFTFYDMGNPAHQRAYAKAEEKKRAAWRMANRAKMDEVLTRYGSEEAVFASTDEDQAYDAMIESFRKTGEPGKCDTWDGEHFSPSLRVRATLASVKPWPDTIPDAITEYEYWEKLYDDRNIADSNSQYNYLGQGADFRRWALGDLIDKEIEARNISDVIIRLRFQEASQGTYNDSDAILRDLERLHTEENSQRPDPASGDISPDRGSPATSDGEEGAPENRATPPFILNTASKRRVEVERILSTPEGARMSLRQVAGMAGVSPTTAGSIKKRMAASAQL